MAEILIPYNLRPLIKFGLWCLEQHQNDGYPGDIDGGAAQDKAVELGVLEERTMTEPCGDACTCAETCDFPTTCNFRAQQTINISAALTESPKLALDRRRIGRFSIVDDFLAHWLNDFLGLFAEMVVVRAEHLYAERVIEYTAISPLFDAIPEGQMAPYYTVTFTTDKDGATAFQFVTRMP